MQSKVAVLVHYLNGDFIPSYSTCCQAICWYIQLFWGAEANFRIQFRLSFKVVGIAACEAFTWRRTRPLVRSYWNTLLQTGTACTASALLIAAGHRFSNDRGTLHLQNELLCRCFRIHPKCQTPFHVLSFSCLIALPCSWKLSAADIENNFWITFGRPSGRLCRWNWTGSQSL